MIDEILRFHPHYDVLIVLGALAFGYHYLSTRVARRILPPGTQAVTRRQRSHFYVGLGAIFLVSSWPIHDIGEQSLFTFHMIEHLVIGLMAAPLLLLGTPRWMAEFLVHEPKQVVVLKAVTHPLVGFLFFNTVLAGLHWPQIIDLMVTIPWVHFAVHATLFTSAILMWMPVVSPHPEVARLKPPGAMMYLFAQSLVPTIPSAFLIFGNTPLYEYYAEAPKLWNWDPMMDQAIAGVIMKLGGGFLLWAIITVIWFRWYRDEKEWDRLERNLREKV